MKTRKTRQAILTKTILAGSVAALFSSPSSHAADGAWTGATSGAWLTTTNWSPAAAPGSTTATTNLDIATFSAAPNPTIGINMNTTNGVYYLGAIDNTNATARIINNSSTTSAGILTLNGATVNSVANTILRNSTTTLLTITNGTGSGTMGMALGNTTNNVIQLTNTGGITINSIISGGANNPLTLQGGGTGVLLLAGANTYSGVTNVNAGTIQVSTATGLGTTTGNTVVVSGGRVLLGTTNLSLAEAFNISGTGTGATASNGALNFGGNATGMAVTGAITLSGAARIQGDGSTGATLSGGINIGANALTYNVDGGANHIINTAGISGTGGSLIKSGGGNLTLNVANTYSGGTTVWDSGTLAVGAAGTLGSNVNTNNVAINDFGVLTLAASGNIGSNQTITLASSSKNSPTGFSSAGTAGPVGRLAVLGLGFNGLPSATIAQSDTNGGVIAINGVTGYNTDLSTLLTSKNLYLGAIGTSTFTGAAGTVAAGNGSTYRLGGGGGQITFSTTNLFTSNNAVQVGSTFNNGGGTVVLSESQDYSGATTVTGGASLNISAANGAASSSSGFTLNGGRLFLDSSTNNNTNRIGNVAVTLTNGGELSLSGNASGTTESFGNLTVGAGPSTVTVKAVTANSTLAGAVFSRSNNGTALFRGTSLGGNVTPMGQITMSDISGLSLVGTTTLNNAPSTDTAKDVKIVPYLIGDTSDTGTGSTFVTYDTTLGFRALNTTNHFNTTAVAGTNVRLAAAQTGINTMSINSLIIANTGTTTITDGQTLTVASGAVLFNASGTALNTPSILGPVGTTGKLSFGSAEGVVTVTNGVFGRISSNIEGSGGLTVGGTGNLTLSGTNTFTGGLVINGGTLRFSADANLGDASNTITINGNTAFQLSANTSVARSIVLNNGAMLWHGGNVSFTNTGNVSGSGGVGTANVSFGSIMFLNGTNNTFEGPVVVGLNMTGGNSSLVSVASLADSSTANGRIVFASLVTHATLGATFRYTGTSNLTLNNRQIELAVANTNPGHKLENNSTNNSIMTVNTDLLVTGTGARIFQLNGTSTATNVFGGKIVDGIGAPVSLIVNTSGAWRLSGANTYTGTTTITAGKLLMANPLALQNSAYVTTGSTGAIGLDVSNGLDSGKLTLGGLSGAVDLATAITGYGSVQELILNPQGTQTNTYTGVIANGAANMKLTKTGTGTQVLSTAASTFSGATTVSAGTLSMASNLIANSSGIFIGNGATLEHTGAANFVIPAGVNVTGTGATGTLAISPLNTAVGFVISGGSTISNNAGGSLTISRFDVRGTSNIVSAGTLLLGVGNSNRGLLVGNTATSDLTIQTGATVTTSGGTSDILGNGTGVTGTLIIAGGTYNANNALSLGNGASGGQGTLTLNSGAAVINSLNFNTSSTQNSIVNLNGGNLTLNAVTYTQSATNRVFNFDGGQLITGGSLTFANLTTNVKNGGAKIDTNGFNSTISSDLVNFGGNSTGGLTKTGAGTLTLAGNSNYTGNTAVNAGTLIVSGALSGSVALSVGAAGTLGGAGDGIATGLIAGATTVANGGKLSPGNTAGAVGTLNFGNNLDLSAVNTVGSFVFQLGDPLNLTSSDKVNLTAGTLNIGTGVGFSEFNFTAISGFGPGTYTLFDSTTGISGSLDPADLTGNLTFGPDTFIGTLSLANSNNDLVLTVVPEPSSVALLGLGVFGLMRRRRRQS